MNQQLRADIALLWNKGVLSYKLHPHQRAAHERTWRQFRGARMRRFLWRWSRRLGKTFTGQLMAVEACVKTPKWRIVVAAPSAKHLEAFVKPAIESICSDAPPEHRPKWVGREGCYVFPNGSRIALHGCDTDAKIDLMGRGPAANGLIFEEAGHIPNLKKAITVTQPQLLSTRKLPESGWALFVGTPPDSSAHYFVELCRRYGQVGQEIHYTIYQNVGQYSEKELIEFMEESADGQPLEEYKKTDEFRREYLGALIGDPTRKVLKRANETTLATCVERYRSVHSRPLPTHRRFYESMDVGWSPDWTFWLIGWWHFESRTLVVEREKYYREGLKRETLRDDVKVIEEELLGTGRRSAVRDGFEGPSRWSDYDAILLNELADKDDLLFATTAKDDRDTAIDNCDRMVGGSATLGNLAINPDGCPMLLRQMDAAIWNKGRTEFARNEASKFGHYDGVAALVYLTRNVMRDEDPRPPGWDAPDQRYLFVPEPVAPQDGDAEQWRALFGVG